MKEVFVFPLQNLVFHPHMVIPLSVNEGDAIRMVKDAIDSKTPIALVTENKNQASDRFKNRIAGFGEPVILQERSDGSLALFIRGLGKVALCETLSEKPYVSCRAAVIDEETRINSANRFRYHRLMRLLRRFVERQDEVLFPKDEILFKMKDPEFVVEILASIVINEMEEQQKILEMNDINEKIHFLTQWFDTHGGEQWINQIDVGVELVSEG